MPCFDKPTADRVQRRAFLTLLDEEISLVMIDIVGIEEGKLNAFSHLADLPTIVQNQCQAFSSMMALSTLLDEVFGEVKKSLTKTREDLTKLKSIYMPPQIPDMPTAVQNQRQTASDLFTLVYEDLGQVRICTADIGEHLRKVRETMADIAKFMETAAI